MPIILIIHILLHLPTNLYLLLTIHSDEFKPIFFFIILFTFAMSSHYISTPG